MDTGWPREIQRSADGSGVVYRLPTRPLGALRWIGVLPCGFGLLFVLSPLKMLVRYLGHLGAGQPFEVMDLIPILFGVPFFLAGLIPVALGCFILFGRCRVECRNRRLKIVESAGPFRWTRRLTADRVHKLEVAFGKGDASGTAASSQAGLGRLAALSAYTGAPKPSLVVLGYPRPWLLAMARELSALLNPLPGISPGATVEVNEDPMASLRPPAPTAPESDVETPPPDSKVQIQHRPESLTITVPPAGLRKGSHGLVVFATIWCGFMALLTFLTTGGTRQGPPSLILVPFWSIGLGLMAISTHLGRRRFVIIVKDDTLHITRISPFGTKQTVHPAADLDDIRVGPSGVEVNHRPIPELQLHPHSGRKIGLLGGRDEQELLWIATHLRRATGVAKPPPRPIPPPPVEG